MVNKRIVCLGGGIGTANLIKGLKEYFQNIVVVVSMADDGGSSGRLRRLYNMAPPGDLVYCMAASVDKENSYISKLLTYRFAGNRYRSDSDISGHKLGNLIMVAMRDLEGSFEKAISRFQKTFGIKGVFLPATVQPVSISAETIEGKKIFGEEKIDLGKYPGKRILEQVFLEPRNAKASPEVIKRIENADVIIAGPGDLYTTILPVLIVEEIALALKKSHALKLFIVNVANKPFETRGYNVGDYIKALKRHLGELEFSKIIVNNNFSIEIPKKYQYGYVEITESVGKAQIVQKDLVNEDFPLYHNSTKLAKTIVENI